MYFVIKLSLFCFVFVYVLHTEYFVVGVGVVLSFIFDLFQGCLSFHFFKNINIVSIRSHTIYSI